MKYFFFLFFLSITACNTYKTINSENSIEVTNGKLQGVSGNHKSITVFKGIPFAAPPTGNLRWKAPQPPIPWNGIRKFDTFCNSCAQNLGKEHLPWTKEYKINNTTSEDCLGLNIWTPAKQQSDKLPVLVYIHGGAFKGGSGSVALYNGENLAKKGIVVVTINYRLGIFGFFTHPELSQESLQNTSGNYGLLDQIAALKWIQKNISKFGGNPNNITISGQSAGARSVMTLTASPLAKGLFHKVIAQSGPFSNKTTIPLNESEKKGVAFTHTLNKTSIAELRKIPTKELFLKSIQYKYKFMPTIDGWLLTDNLKEVYKKGLQNDVPILTGFNSDENSHFKTYGKLNKEEFSRLGKERFGNRYNDFIKLYPFETEKNLKKSQIQLLRDIGFVNMYTWATLREKTSNHKTFKYYFERAAPWPQHPQYRAFHSSEIPYTFGNLKFSNKNWEAIDYTISELITDYWVNFIKHGTPNTESLPKWPSEKNKIIKLGQYPKSDTLLSQQKRKLYQLP